MSRFLRLGDQIASLVRSRIILAGLILTPWLLTTVIAAPDRAGLTEGLLVEADAKYGTQELAGRVLIHAGQGEWTTVATGKKSTTVRLEARASLVEADVVEIETRFAGADGSIKQSGKIVVRVGERAELTQLEGDATTAVPATTSGADSRTVSTPNSSSVAVKVLRVRYSL